MPLNIPQNITAGDTITWTSELTNYPASTYTLSWSFRGASSLDVTSSADGEKHLTTISSAQTETLTPGQYFYQCYATNLDGERITVGMGEFMVFPNFSLNNDPFDGRSDNQQMLDAVTAAIKSILKNGAVKDYRIKEREMTHTDLAELYRLENNLRLRVAREQAASQGINNSKLFVRFNG